MLEPVPQYSLFYSSIVQLNLTNVFIAGPGTGPPEQNSIEYLERAAVATAK